MNKNVAYHSMNLKRSDPINLCFTRDETVHIKVTERGKPQKVYCLNFVIKIPLIMIFLKERM